MNIIRIAERSSKLLLLAAGLSVFSTTAFGAACNTFTNLQQLETAGSCTIALTNFTETFSNFNETGITPANINVSTEFGNISGSAGFTFTDSAGGSLGSFSGLTYTATIGSCTAGMTCGIDGVLEQTLFANRTPNGSLVVTESAGTSPVTLTPTTQTFGPTTFASVSAITKSTNYDGAGTLQSFESDVYGSATSAVPEPATMALVGAALLGVSMLRKKVLAARP